MKRPFKHHTSGLTSPLSDGVEIVPDDAEDLPTVTRAVHVGVSGNLRVTLVSGRVVTLTAVAAGWHPIRVTRVWAAGTTATALFGGW